MATDPKSKRTFHALPFVAHNKQQSKKLENLDAQTGKIPKLQNVAAEDYVTPEKYLEGT